VFFVLQIYEKAPFFLKVIVRCF